MAGDDNALTPTEQHGIRVFNEKGKCVTCHNGPNFTDNKFHALGLPKREGIPNDIGRYAITQDEAEKDQFKTPTLRNIAQTAPYMHNGMFATLEEVVEFYVRAERTTSPRHPLITPLTLLTDHDKKALIEFLKSLTGEPVKITPPKLPE
ncbi:MAG: c-type cytochrome [Candidatus Manganitrophus sp.]|nr:MAG: c-type cytochrome [Candidatus Manganitrophus sp.]